MEPFFEFEKPIAALEKKLEELRALSSEEKMDLVSEISNLEKKVTDLIENTYSSLNPWQKVQLSRHPNRPYTRDYIEALFPDFMELKGDRAFGQDDAMIAGIANWAPNHTKSGSFPVLVMGQQKGRSTKQKMMRNFGMVKPEGYRKAMRLMQLAERSRMPIITFIDTPGAYPGIEAEERGQSQAIAESIRVMFELTVPVISIVIGEGGSGGALAIGIANRVLMQEYSTYSVISPESCASILWSDSALAEKASERLKMNPSELHRLGVIDTIVSEPKGGAHRNWDESFKQVQKALSKEMLDLLKQNWKSTEVLKEDRIKKFRKMGQLAIGHTEESKRVKTSHKATTNKKTTKTKKSKRKSKT